MWLIYDHTTGGFASWKFIGYFGQYFLIMASHFRLSIIHMCHQFNSWFRFCQDVVREYCLWCVQWHVLARMLACTALRICSSQHKTGDFVDTSFQAVSCTGWTTPSYNGQKYTKNLLEHIQRRNKLPTLTLVKNKADAKEANNKPKLPVMWMNGFCTSCTAVQHRTFLINLTSPSLDKHNDAHMSSVGLEASGSAMFGTVVGKTCNQYYSEYFCRFISCCPAVSCADTGVCHSRLAPFH